jgi:hypothetical protein
MKIRSLVKEKKFIPDFEGNKDLADKEQIVVNIKKFPSIEDLGKIKAFKYDAVGNIIINYDNSYVLKNFIGGLKNIEVEKVDKDMNVVGEEVIENGSALSKTTATELESLVVEIRTYLLETVEELDKGEGNDSE